MSSKVIIPPSGRNVSRKASAQIMGLLLLALLGALALIYNGYQLHRLETAKDSYKDAEQQYHLRAEIIDRLNDMQTAFHRYLLDTNTVNLDLLQADKQVAEQLAKQDAAAQKDQLLQGVIAAEQKWNDQVQPLVEERKRSSGGQGISEDLVAKYRAAHPDLQLMAAALSAEKDQHEAEQALQQAEGDLRLLWLPFPIATLVVIVSIWLAQKALKSISQLREMADVEVVKTSPDNKTETQ